MQQGVAVGIDVAKDFHWAQAVDRRDSEVLFSGRVDNTPPALAAFVEHLEALRDRGPLKVGIDVVGGIAGVLTAMLLDAGIEVVHVPGLAVNRAREGTTGGEHKSDPRDAGVIAEQVRHRRDLRPIEPLGELDAEIRLLVARRRELVGDQTRRINRLRDLLASIHPGLERVVDPTTKAGQQLLSRYVTPTEIRHAGRRRLAEHILRAGRIARRHADDLADKALAAAREQTITVPGERVAADLVRELALEAARTRSRLCALDGDLQAALTQHPDAALIQSLPGMGATLEPSSSPRQAASTASRPPTGSPPPRAWPPCSNSRARSATSNAPTPATGRSSASSSNPPFARSATPTARPSTAASGPNERPITKPSSPSPAAASTSCTPCCAIEHPTNTDTPPPLDKRIRQRVSTLPLPEGQPRLSCLTLRQAEAARLLVPPRRRRSE